jgi:hypothetical protein
VLIEQWIRAKYLREEFVSSERQDYMSGHLEGMLLKRGKNDGKFVPRKFVLSETDGVLRYYIKEVS